MGMDVKIRNGKLLRMFKQIAPDSAYYLLAGMDHELIVAESRQRSAAVHNRHQHDNTDESGNISRQDVFVDNRLEHIGAYNIRQTADAYQQRYQSHRPFINSHVMEHLFHGFLSIFRTCVSIVFRHYKSAPSCWD